MRKLTATMALLVSGMSANAGTVELVNGVWDYIAVVEVKKGLNGSQVERHEDVVRGDYIASAPDKLCYRRSSDPGNAQSPLTRWNCTNQVINGVSTVEVR